MDGNSDLPIALRRTRRNIKGPEINGPARRCDDAPPEHGPAPLRTPAKRSRSGRQVRFSEPKPAIGATKDVCLSTGLTPMVRRTSLFGGRTPRRHSTPARLNRSSNGSGIPDLDSQGSPLSGEVRFLPLRQVLDGRVKRRIRRNGLSEEMNTIAAEKRQKSKDIRAEIERLKSELAKRDEEIARLHDETVVLDTDRVWNLEQEVAALRKELASRSGGQTTPSSPNDGWTRAARDPFSDDYSAMDIEHDDDEFGESTIAELACSTPTRRMRTSFPTPPATSPPPQEMPTPCKRAVAAPHFDSGIQASLPDPQKRELERKLESLQVEVDKLTATLESYSALTTRLSDKLAASSSKDIPTENNPSPRADLETRLASVLQALSDKTAALAEVNSSLKTLGFPGSDALEIIDSIRSSFRTARLELEYITPGEITLPLTSAGAAVLDLLVTRLRDLSRAHREARDSIDEHHSIELSLRQQLSARVDAMDLLSTQLADKDARIADLELGADRLRGAADRYARDLAELEALVARLDGDLAGKQSAIASLEADLAAALGRAASLQSQLDALSAAHEDRLRLLVRAHGEHLAQRDARVLALRDEVDSVRAGLREACETVMRLRVENGRLQGERDEALERADREARRASEMVEGVRAELERVMGGLAAYAAAAGFGGGGGRGLEGGAGEGGKAEEEEEEGEEGGEEMRKRRDGGRASRMRESAGGVVVAGAKEGPEFIPGREKKRRRYDSGLGMLDEEDGEAVV